MTTDIIATSILNQTITTVLLTSIITWLLYFVFQPALSQRDKIHSDKIKDSNDLVLEEVITIQQQPSQRDDEHEHERQRDSLLSIIIPAYNEETRLPPMLLSTIGHLKSSQDEIISLCNDIIYHDDNDDDDTNRKDRNSSKPIPYEIIIVNDGSKDKTVEVVNQSLETNFPLSSKSSYKNDINTIMSIRLLTLTQNCGKGAAVKIGMLHSNGKLCLMVDADDATNFQPSIIKLLQQMKIMMRKHNNSKQQEPLMVFGSRAHLQEDSKAKRSLVRTILMVAFHFFVKTLCSSMIHDTQCGFKLFTKDAAKVLFSNLHLTRWAFDTELIVIAERLGIPIAEVGVEWQEVDGSKLATSKLALLVSSVEMLRDMLCVKIMYTIGLWRLKTVTK